MKERPRTVLARPVMREAFRKELRARLMAEAAAVLAPRPRRPFFEWSFLRPALAVAALVLAVAWGTTSAAAASLPGDPLYGLKRAQEDVQVALTFNDVARMQLLSDLADRRLAELAEIAQQHPAVAPTATVEYEDAVDRFDAAVDELRDADDDDKRAAAEAVAAAAREKHLAVLDALRDRVPDAARPAIERVIENAHEREGVKPSDVTQPTGTGDNRATPRPAEPTRRPVPRPTSRGNATPRPSDRN